ncbi:succinate dehydrogenase/fumarate reductase iron-sulfur subunit [Pontibacter sp. G13]|uniref:succinate dehydrogenase/fumarate reductase iron-sulfur subunit n=1 Tax=Pontibacter sp. G13 TaxID=3074898 RepID=UPI00288A708D|nr:succinate dehydrogenase/fumarate reductase iron-sulfur subunit [Pontibacter sp. G13]WNJ18015.1 succinate dehydrogenase/fumarate reductase iron-sulfur subunit [Pontibacter sp. G13]
MKINLKVWRQKGPDAPGKLVDYALDNVSQDMSFLEMLDMLNEKLIVEGEEPVAFDHDCREGICGACGVVINGQAHGPNRRTTTCQLHMRSFNDGDEIYIEPWRARAFPIIKDLMVDRTAFDSIIQAGGFISANTGSAPDANEILVGKDVSDHAMNAAECIGCGACVASCKNASAMLFTAAKAEHLNTLPQGKPERNVRVQKMVLAMDEAGFGNCTNTGACEVQCPKGISITNIAAMNANYVRSMAGSEVKVTK